MAEKLPASLRDASAEPAERRRPRRFFVWTIGAAFVIGGVAVAPSLLLTRRAVELPDVGEPFDVGAFTAFTLPNEQNAISQYLLAQRGLVQFDPPKTTPPGSRMGDSPRREAFLSWSQANDAERKWLEANRITLEVWKEGTARDQAIEVPYDTLTTMSLLLAATDARRFGSLALLAASREAAEGRAAAAWSWYLAALRASRHFCMHAAGIERSVGISVYSLARDPILNWSSRPELTAADLRQALSDAVTVDGMTPPLSETFKTEYISERNGLSEILANLSEHDPWAAVETRFSNRPEVMQRALKLFFANWIAHADRPRAQRHRLPDTSIPLFEPDSPGEPALPSPAVLKSVGALWLTGLEAHGSTAVVPPLDFALPGMIYLFDADDRDRVNRAAVILGLALQLCFREHGDFPPTLTELVKAGYLKSIPLDPFGKGEPMHYRVEGNPATRAVLWSVGLDGINTAAKLPDPKTDKHSSEETVFEIVAPRKRR